MTQSGGQAEVHTLSAVTRVFKRFFLPWYNIFYCQYIRLCSRLPAAVQHPDYRPIEGEGYPADLAVLILSTPVEASNLYIEPGNLAPAGNETDVDFVGQYCHIIGWGQTSGEPIRLLQLEN